MVRPAGRQQVVYPHRGGSRRHRDVGCAQTPLSEGQQGETEGARRYTTGVDRWQGIVNWAPTVPVPQPTIINWSWVRDGQQIPDRGIALSTHLRRRGR